MKRIKIEAADAQITSPAGHVHHARTTRGWQGPGDYALEFDEAGTPILVPILGGVSSGEPEPLKRP